jgi:polyhydroxyalkanoate synthesis repressor PhaR
MSDAAESVKKLEIKKYPNRRYYDATHSRHLTLEQVRSLVQSGFDIQVIDARSGADITAQVLTQIILEFDTPKLDSLPVPLLVRLIRMNDQLVKDFIEKYFNQALKSFFEYQQQMEQHVRQAQGLANFPLVSAWTQAVFGPLAGDPGTQTAGSSPPRTPETEQLAALVKDLQRQVAELKSSPVPRPSRKRRRSRSKVRGRTS